MQKSPEQSQLSPEEIAEIEKERTLSDAELIIGGARYSVDKEGDKLLVLEPKQVERIEKEHIEERAREIANEFTSLYRDRFDYPQQIVEIGETPEAYIFNGRRIVRQSLELVTKKLLETGKVKLETENKDYDQVKHSSGLFRLSTTDTMYMRFVDAINGMLKHYPAFFEGSFEVLTKKKY